MNNNGFNWRKFTSFGLFLSFLMILLSGVMLYIFPGSRGSGFIWEMGGLTKQAWQQQHTIFGFAFSLFSLCHLFLINWKAFFSYLKTKTASGFRRPAEMVIIVLLSLFTGVGTLMGIQPFSGIIDLGKGISKSWDRNEQGAGAAPSSERLSLAELSSQDGLEGEGEADTYERPENSNRMEDGAGFGYRHRYHRNHEELSSASSSSELDFLQDEINVDNSRASKAIAATRVAPVNNSEAPDDELHRRTTKSCSACH